MAWRILTPSTALSRDELMEPRPASTRPEETYQGRPRERSATAPHERAISPCPLPHEREDGAREWRLCCLGLAAGCLLLSLVGAQRYDLLADDEIRYAEAGRRMLETGNLVIPEFNGYPRYQKPMLFYWLQALSFGLFGVTPWAARLPVALAGMGVVLTTASLAKALWGLRAGLWSGIVLATSVEMFLLSRMVMTDVVLLLFVQGAMSAFCFARLARQPAEAERQVWIMHACLAMGVLTKGPVALVLPALVIGPWAWLRGELWKTLRLLRIKHGLALILLVAGPWYGLAHWYSGGDFTRQFLLEENLGRFTSVVNLHRQPAVFYLLLLIPMTFPWTGVAPQALLAARRTPFRFAPFADAATWLFLWQILLVLLVFSFSKTRVWTYTLPAFPPLALLIARWLFADATRKGARPLRAPLRLLAAISIPFALAFQLLPLSWLPAEARMPELLAVLRLALWLLALMACLLVCVERRARLSTTLAWLSGGVTAWYLFACLSVAPTLDRLWKQPVRDLAEIIRRHPRSAAVTYQFHELGLNFHAGLTHVPHIRTRYRWELEQLLYGNRPVFVMVSPESLHELAGMPFHVWHADRRLIYGSNVPPPRARDQESGIRGQSQESVQNSAPCPLSPDS